MSREVKIIIFSILLLISIINKQCNSKSDYTSSTSASNSGESNEDIDPNVYVENPAPLDDFDPNDYEKITPAVKDTTNNSDYYPTTRPENGFSPYDSYYGKGIYNNTDNIIKVTAPLSQDIVIMIEDIYSAKMVRNEYIRANTTFSNRYALWKIQVFLSLWI